MQIENVELARLRRKIEKLINNVELDSLKRKIEILIDNVELDIDNQTDRNKDRNDRIR